MKALFMKCWIDETEMFSRNSF